jgi:hypothetical protein
VAGLGLVSRAFKACSGAGLVQRDLSLLLYAFSKLV